MQKIQILFPNPLMGRVRAVAAEEDRPVSEIIRRAVERFLEMKPNKPSQNRQLPTFRGGEILVSAENLKDALYNDESFSIQISCFMRQMRMLVSTLSARHFCRK